MSAESSRTCLAGTGNKYKIMTYDINGISILNIHPEIFSVSHWMGLIAKFIVLKSKC